MATRPHAVQELGDKLPTIPLTDVTGEYSANAALSMIRGYTTEEVVSAACVHVTEPGQSKAIVMALAARYAAKTAKRITKEHAK